MEVDKRLQKYFSDRVALRFVTSTSDGRRLIVKCVLSTSESDQKCFQPLALYRKRKYMQ